MAMLNQYAVHELVAPPRISGEGGIVLVRRLLNSAPDDMTAAEKKALKRARDGAVDVQRIMKLRARRRPENLQAEDRALDGCWGAIHDQLKGWTRIPNHPLAQEAQRLLNTLYATGLEFTTTKYEVQWVESSNRLERIDEESLEERLLALIHPALMPLLQEAHEVFGEKLGVGETVVEVPETRELVEAIHTLSFLIANYARVMSGAIDIDDERTIARFEKAMAPLAAYRDENSTTRSDGDEPADPEADVIDPEAPIPEPPPVDEPVTGEPVTGEPVTGEPEPAGE